MAHQLNTNMVFRWRRELGARATDIAPVSPKLLPIVLERQSESPATPIAQGAPADYRIEVLIGDACVRVSGMPDETALRAVFRSLRR